MINKDFVLINENKFRKDNMLILEYTKILYTEQTLVCNTNKLLKEFLMQS